MTAIFHHMMHDCLEDYVDDIVVKSKEKERHLFHLKRLFKRCRQYKLRMNPLKCAFGVISGKFLGFNVHKNGISIANDKIAAIKDMRYPSSKKELKSFLGKVSYLRRFIPAVAELINPMQHLFHKGVTFVWGEPQSQAFEKNKECTFLSCHHDSTSSWKTYDFVSYFD